MVPSRPVLASSLSGTMAQMLRWSQRPSSARRRSARTTARQSRSRRQRPRSTKPKRRPRTLLPWAPLDLPPKPGYLRALCPRTLGPGVDSVKGRPLPAPTSARGGAGRTCEPAVRPDGDLGARRGEWEYRRRRRSRRPGRAAASTARRSPGPFTDRSEYRVDDHTYGVSMDVHDAPQATRAADGGSTDPSHSIPGAHPVTLPVVRQPAKSSDIATVAPPQTVVVIEQTLQPIERCGARIKDRPGEFCAEVPVKGAWPMPRARWSHTGRSPQPALRPRPPFEVPGPVDRARARPL